MPIKKKFIVVDDHPLYRTGISALVKQELDFDCVGEAATIQEALEIVEKNRPDFAILDISLRQQNGLSLVSTLKSMYSDLLMLVVSMHDETIYGERAIKAGARGYIMKHQPPEQLIGAIKLILGGNIAVSDNLKTRLFESMMSGKDTVEPVNALSDREFEVFCLIGKGYSAAEIAEHLTLSVKTINTYQDHIKEKLKIPSANELRRFALGWANRNN
jgi:DNA-binding NarL/FixJ family response regulator